MPVGKDQWDMVEVKSSTKVKEDYLYDVSFQKYCYESAGLKIRKCFVLHVNNEYTRRGKINAKKFFMKRDITEKVLPLLKEVPSNVEKLLKIAALKNCPEFGNGEDCHPDPSGIHDSDRFWKDHPKCDILELNRGGERAIEWFNSGIFHILELNGSHELSEKQLIQQDAIRTGKHHHDAAKLSEFIKRLKYPLYFLDFESYQTAIPLYDGLRPYQQIPFQFSVHIVQKKGARPKSVSFIAEGSADPRPKFTEALKKSLGTDGSIIVYNQSFEQGVMKALGEFMPEYKKWADSATKRMVDLLAPFRDFSYYHPSQNGSASIKAVLPALTGMSYNDFEIGNGQDASLSYLYITHGSADGKMASAEEARKVRENLETYCGQDTLGMVKIVDKLYEMITG